MDLLAQMATFVRVVEGKSLSSAARAMRLSLPAVSRQLRALEEELGATLVVRSTRRLRVTDAGRRWYEHCARILREVDEARADVRATKNARGRLVVSASLTYGMIFIVPRLPRLAEAHPALAIDLRLEDQLVDLVGEGVDIAVRAGSPPPDSTAFVAHPLASMRRVLVASPRYLREHGVPRAPGDLARHLGLVQVTTAGAVIRWRLRPARGDDGDLEVMPGESRVRVNAPIALRDLARSGAGIAYVPEWLVEADVAAKTLRRVLPGWSSPPLGAWAVHRAELRGMPRVRAFVDALKAS
jgi:DNA-binding transcriptional LysR family regulator